MEQFFSVLMGAAGGGGVVGSLVLWMLKRWAKRDKEEREALRDEVARLRREKIDVIERKLDEHLREDNPGMVAAQLSAIAAAIADLTSMQREMSAKVSKIDRELGGTVERVAAQQVWIANINEAIQRHLNHSQDRRG